MQKLNCRDLSSEQINEQIKSLILQGFKNIFLENSNRKEGLLKNFTDSVKVQINGDVGNNFACNIHDLKIVVKGNVSDSSANNVKNAKFIIFGSCQNNFANNVDASEFYVLKNCGKNSFLRLKHNSKVVIGGKIKEHFATSSNNAIIVILNLYEDNLSIDENSFKGSNESFIYLRAHEDKINLLNRAIQEVNDNDEDIYLPLISEFARLFNYSLSEIKSVPFYRLK